MPPVGAAVFNVRAGSVEWTESQVRCDACPEHDGHHVQWGKSGEHGARDTCDLINTCCDLNLLGCSGGVVNSLDRYPASLTSLCCFYFRCVLSSQ